MMSKQTSPKLASQTHTNTAWLMWFCAAFFYFYQFILRVSPTGMAGEIKADLGLENCDLGLLISYYYNGYAWVQIPVGIVLDLIGPRRPLALATGLCMLGCILFGMSENIGLMAIGRFIMGVGSAFAFLSSLKIANLWFPQKQLPLMVALTMLLGSIGATIAGTPLSAMIDAMGWRSTMIALGAIGGVLTISSFMIVKDHPSHAQTTVNQELKTVAKESLYLIRHTHTWVFGLFGLLMYVPLSGFADLWGTAYIMATFEVSKLKASGALSMFYVGIGVGGPIVAWLSHYFHSHRAVMRWAACAGGTLFLYLLYGPLIPFSILPLYMLALGLCASVQFLAFTSVSVLNPQHLSGRSTGIHNMFSMMSGVIFQPLIGKLLDICPTIYPGVEATSARGFAFALVMVPFSMLLSFILTFMMKESYISEERPLRKR